MDFISSLYLDTRIGSLIGSTLDLMMGLSLVCFVKILLNGLDFVDESSDLDGTMIGIMVGSTKDLVDLVLNLSLICFVRILFKV